VPSRGPPPEVTTGSPPPPPSAFYLGHTPRVRQLKHLTDMPGTGERPPDAAPLPALVMPFGIPSHVAIGFPRSSRRSMSGLSARHSFRGPFGLRFRGLEDTSCSPTHERRAFRHRRATYRRSPAFSAFVSRLPYRQAVVASRLSWLSSSPSESLRTPSCVISPVPPVTRSETPHAGRVGAHLRVTPHGWDLKTVPGATLSKNRHRELLRTHFAT